eukprot:CAMPEP_0180637964 /NCGR_PEP_ID=MMETSP1037_2-20121125/44002_1 /TAXON_ID=632150 /ORGANISM="Azadinium spinosum, Strain 3D9" /LENGTH=51 /DNA_ID=CAMNT_0022659321 /DNA_START=99 /DNA_END=251 /DNA_ORIENTATION=+
MAPYRPQMGHTTCCMITPWREGLSQGKQPRIGTAKQCSGSGKHVFPEEVVP